MIVDLTATEVTLREARDFGHFHVLASAGAQLDEIDRCLRSAGAGRVHDEHALIDSAWLRAAGDGSASWTHGLDEMLRYAKSKGWLEGDAVQAHIQTAQT